MAMLLANPTEGLEKPFSARYWASTIRVLLGPSAPLDFVNSINHATTPHWRLRR
ncbi:MAG: hypothetical protein AVDCRST_MAG88-2287 [uncultured Thermomicrobiales bacterium]|uniref:Uncharacterized protein n=1 Tax=uncultured Thermomicrobiales bacterium TaxID=1645740 RepID=A0A6J4V735_9BACT|nr:MAG: hypothetical protein AVDCRST_MAG88-2287 [uncultured Thermomicrobiales bacterium]